MAPLVSVVFIDPYQKANDSTALLTSSMTFFCFPGYEATQIKLNLSVQHADVSPAVCVNYSTFDLVLSSLQHSPDLLTCAVPFNLYIFVCVFDRFRQYCISSFHGFMAILLSLVFFLLFLCAQLKCLHLYYYSNYMMQNLSKCCEITCSISCCDSFLSSLTDEDIYCIIYAVHCSH